MIESVEELELVFFGQLWAQFDAAESAPDTVQHLSYLEPATLDWAVRQGVLAFFERLPMEFVHSKNAAAAWADEASAYLVNSSTVQTWNELMEMASTGMAGHFVEGALCKETAIGATIGSFILPGIGTMIGAAIGGMMRGDSVEAHYNQNYQHFAETIDRASSVIHDRFRFVVSAYEKDLGRS